MFLGPPGHDDPAYKPVTDLQGGTSGPPQRSAVKKRKRVDAAEKRKKEKAAKASTKSSAEKRIPVKGSSKDTPAPASSCGTLGGTAVDALDDDLQDTSTSPTKGLFASMSVAITSVGTAIGQQNEILQKQADSLDKTAAAEAKKARIEALKLQLQVRCMCTRAGVVVTQP